MSRASIQIFGSRIGRIYPAIPQVWECSDGTYSTSSGSRRCARHGGPKSANPVNYGGGRLNVTDVPLRLVLVDPKLFQGREKHFSQRSVDNILEDVRAGKFKWANLDPVTLWKAPDGRLFILSGHSRFEAFRRLAAAGAQAEGKTFDAIPAKIFENLPVQAAQTVALESNTLSTKENDVERATYYRNRRQEGLSRNEWLNLVKRNEGRNWVNIAAYANLNPNGRTWSTLRQMAEGEDTSATLAKSLAKWIGRAREVYPGLTNGHENELYQWLFDGGGYGTGRGKVSNERDFLEQVGKALQKNVQGDYSRPLNLAQSLVKSPVEAQFDAQVDEARQEVSTLEKQVRDKIADLSRRGASRADVQRLVSPLQVALTSARVRLNQLQSKRDEVLQYAAREQTLFGIGRIVRPWEGGKAIRRGCRDGQGTTVTWRGGCSWHGGYRPSEYDVKRAQWRTEMKRRLRQAGQSLPTSDKALLDKYRRTIGPYPTLSEYKGFNIKGYMDSVCLC